MDGAVLGAVGDAFITLMDPFRLLMLSAGVIMGLFLGIVPGIGGLAGMALLLPFTYTMDPYAAFAMLLGMLAVSGTSDTISAILFGVPGSAGAQALVMDGYPMTKRGEAGRALAAAYTSSLIGGVMGAVLLAISIPILRPVMLHIGSPQLLAFSLFGIAMVAVLSGTAPLRGLAAGGIGILLSMIGSDPTTGTQRWTMGTFYLWDGLPLVPMVLGLFALPELLDLAVRRRAISTTPSLNVYAGMKAGFVDTIKNWGTVLRGGGLGAAIGAIPGIGASVVDWLAYGLALQTTKDARKTFGKGDVRGVIAPESANNAITAGSLVPTIAFGVPGSSTMAILLSVFLIHGLVPGPEMLTTNLNMTYSMVWSIAIANILGAGICFALSGQFAKIATLRYTLIIPIVTIFVFIGAFQESRAWGDLYALLIFTVIGWTMRHLKWPRPPLLLGFVLGALIERYMFISTARYGWTFLTDPIVVTLMGLALLITLFPMYKHFRAMGGARGIASTFGAPMFRWSDLVHVVVIGFSISLLVTSQGWPFGARIAPQIVGWATLGLASLALINQVFSRSMVARREAEGDQESHTVYMDTGVDLEGMSNRTLAVRGAIFFAYLLGFLAAIATIGFLPTVPLFIAVYMWLEGRESWKIIVGQAVGMSLFMYVVFDQLLRLPWPPSLLGSLLPALRVIPSV